MFTPTSKSSGVCDTHGFVSISPALGEVCPLCERPYVARPWTTAETEAYVASVYEGNRIWGTY